MKFTRLCVTLILSVIAAPGVRLAAQGNPPPPAAQSATGPLIQLDNPMYDFGRAAVGEKVHHTYMVTNTGNQPLIITKVHPSCGCTTVGDWSTNIAPGQNGHIAIQFDTTRYGNGATVTKTIEIYSNAKNEPRKILMLKGVVWRPIEVAPAVAVINIPADSTNEVSAMVRIRNQTGKPVMFSNPVSASRVFTASLKEIKPSQEYELIVTSQPPYTPGNSPGTITINTSLAGTPILRVPVAFNVAQPIQISPSQITLTTMGSRWITNRVTIHGNTTNVLVLSNPKASDGRIQVALQPLGPKGMYSLLVAFPPGFQAEPGKLTEVTVESNHPRYPLIKIPIRQYPRRMPYAAMTGRPPPPPPVHP